MAWMKSVTISSAVRLGSCPRPPARRVRGRTRRSSRWRRPGRGGQTGAVRVSVVGCSGSGKSTIGRALADGLGVPFVELDSIFWQPDWQPLDDDEFRRRVAEVVAGDGWVIDGNYDVVRPPSSPGPPTSSGSTYPGRSSWPRSSPARRDRVVDRRELWNGNRERISTWLDPEHPIRWAWVHHGTKRVTYPARFASPDYAHVRTHRLTTSARRSGLRRPGRLRSGDRLHSGAALHGSCRRCARRLRR